MKIAALEVEAISNHQLDLGPVCLCHHGLAINFVQGHRLFAKDVYAGAGSGFRISAMHVVGERDVPPIFNLTTKSLTQC